MESMENRKSTETTEHGTGAEHAQSTGPESRVIRISPEDVALETPLRVQFSRPYRFEGEHYDNVDLSGLESLTTQDMLDAEKHLSRNGVTTVLPELSMEYVCYIAALASGQPIEFFKGLSPKDAVKVKNRVTGFFYGED